jgi:hypothetical protein
MKSARSAEFGTTSSGERVVRVERDHQRLVFAHESGRLIELTLSDAQGRWKARVQTERGALARLVSDLRESTARHVNVLDPKRPLNSWTGYLAEQLLRSDVVAPFLFKDVPPADRMRAAAAVRRLFARPLLEPFDALMASRGTVPEPFVVPADPPATTAAAHAMGTTMAFGLVFGYVNEIFAKGSWPWTLAREGAFVAGGKGQYTGMELQRLYDSPDTGPLGHWAIAKWLTSIKSPHAKAFAAGGLQKLSTSSFRRDMRLLFEGDTALRRVADNMLAALPDLDDEDVEALVRILPADTGSFLRRCVVQLRADPGRAFGEVLGEALDEYWATSLRPAVERQLRELAAPAASTGA